MPRSLSAALSAGQFSASGTIGLQEKPNPFDAECSSIGTSPLLCWEPGAAVCCGYVQCIIVSNLPDHARLRDPFQLTTLRRAIAFREKRHP